MKMKMILMSMLAIAALTGCSKSDSDNDPPETNEADVAYLSIKIATQNTSARSSGEESGTNESDLKNLYLLFFDKAENIVGIPGTTDYLVKIPNASSSPSAVKVSAAATKLLVIANPGGKLEGMLNDINVTTTFSTVNTAIKGATREEITDVVLPIAKGFTMINSGDETGKSAGDKISDPLIDISGKIQKVTKDVDDDEAKEAAEKTGNRVQVKIERLASKLELSLKGNIEVKPDGATFVFGNWTLDAVNSTFYPFAEKTLLTVTHSSGGSYTSNFYTVDPNYTNDAGVVNATVNRSTYAPVLVSPYTWMAAADKTYCIENTMSAAEQKFENATRLVIKGTYYPPGRASGGDWFNFAGSNFTDFAALQAAYNAADAGSNLKAACEKMYTKIKEYADADDEVTLTGTSFATLLETDLSQIPNGGEVIKDGRNPVIRWYQNGLCYYYYEIRHDNETTQEMAFAKYGVVRNNWYKLTLGSVKGLGTPWYPDIDNPGPGDPDPKDPIDGTVGYIGITVEVAPWIVWENEIGI